MIEPLEAWELLDGHDKYGEFVLGDGECAVCAVGGPVVRYKRLDLPIYRDEGPLLPKNLVIGKANAEIGITCGCYASFQRQIAHIMTESKYR